MYYDNLQMIKQSEPKPYIIEQHNGISWAVIDTAHKGELSWWERYRGKDRIRAVKRKRNYY